MKIQVWDNDGITADRYQVFIGKHYYHMGSYPDRANDINMYGGEWKSDMDKVANVMRLLQFIEIKKIPKNLKSAIRQRVQEIRRDENDHTNV